MARQSMLILLALGLGLGLTLGLGLIDAPNAYSQILEELDRYIRQLPPEQQSPYSNPQIARDIQEIDLPVYDQPPSTDANINTPDRVNTTNVKAIDFQVNQTYGSPFVIDAQYQNGTLALDVKRYFDCVVDTSVPLYESQGIGFKNTSKSEYVKILEGCISTQWNEQREQEQLMALSPMERALKEKSNS